MIKGVRLGEENDGHLGRGREEVDGIEEVEVKPLPLRSFKLGALRI